MKKGLCIFSLILCILGLCGCETNQNDRGKIFIDLKKEKIISDSMEQVDTESFNHWPLEWCETENYYIYKDKDSKMIAIQYEKDSKNGHLVTIYDDVTINNNVNLISPENANCEESYYKYQNGEYTDKARYILRNEKKYYVTEKSTLFGDKNFSFELAN